jgi:hypothetical protein
VEVTLASSTDVIVITATCEGMLVLVTGGRGVLVGIISTIAGFLGTYGAQIPAK